LLCKPISEANCDAGREVHRRLAVVPAQFKIVEDVRYVYGCRDCEKKSGRRAYRRAINPKKRRFLGKGTTAQR
jgi:hypothetical protein